MNRAVLDASVVLKWFADPREPHVTAALELRRQFEAGILSVFAPTLLYLEIINIASRKWRWEKKKLIALAHALDTLPFTVCNPGVPAIADWAARGLTAYDAAYVALAQAEAISLITDDDLILSTAPGISRPLSSFLMRNSN